MSHKPCLAHDPSALQLQLGFRKKKQEARSASATCVWVGVSLQCVCGGDVGTNKVIRLARYEVYVVYHVKVWNRELSLLLTLKDWVQIGGSRPRPQGLSRRGAENWEVYELDPPPLGPVPT